MLVEEIEEVAAAMDVEDDVVIEESKEAEQGSLLSKNYSVALHKFPPAEKEKAQQKLAQQGFQIVNVPNASNREKVIVVSYDGSFK